MPDRLPIDDPKRATQLAILGVVCRAPTPGTVIVSLVKHIVGRAWEPTSDVIAQALADLVDAGLVGAQDLERAWDTRVYAITPAGRVALDRLLRSPLPPSRATGAIALKVCFLDLLDPRHQAEEVDAILAHYGRELAHLDEAVRRCACDWPYVASWIELEVRRLETERDWFRGIASRLPSEVG